MANSRLERIGTIYSRLTGLLRAGALKQEDKPIWFDVYQHFPPKYPPKFERPIPNVQLQNIYYPEDVTRAKIHKEKSGFVGSVNLKDIVYETNTQKCLAYYEQLRSDCQSDDEALEKAIEKVLTERSLRRENVAEATTDNSPTTTRLADEFRKSKGVNVQDIFKS